MSRRETAPHHRLFLAGHSRSGVAVIFVAQDLQGLGIDVDAMFLYDAVNRTLNNRRDSRRIPGNVQWCHHALRDPEITACHTSGLQRHAIRWHGASACPSGAARCS